MTREECIRDLKGSMELFLFDPTTGEVLPPRFLNEENRMTYDAMETAVRLLEEKPAEPAVKKFAEVLTKEEFTDFTRLLDGAISDAKIHHGVGSKQDIYYSNLKDKIVNMWEE